MHTRKNFITINEGFTCAQCGKKVTPDHAGTCRNHCPFCLFSMHVDEGVPGDRESVCGGLMSPLYAEVDHRKKAILTHQCNVCGKRSRNRVAEDDNWDKVCELSRIPH